MGVQTILGRPLFLRAMRPWSLVAACAAVSNMMLLLRTKPSPKYWAPAAQGIAVEVLLGVAVTLGFALLGCFLTWNLRFSKRWALWVTGAMIGVASPVATVAITSQLTLLLALSIPRSPPYPWFFIAIGLVHSTLLYNVPGLLFSGILGGAVAGEFRFREIRLGPCRSEPP